MTNLEFVISDLFSQQYLTKELYLEVSAVLKQYWLVLIFDVIMLLGIFVTIYFAFFKDAENVKEKRSFSSLVTVVGSILASVGGILIGVFLAFEQIKVDNLNEVEIALAKIEPVINKEKTDHTWTYFSITGKSLSIDEDMWKQSRNIEKRIEYYLSSHNHFLTSEEKAVLFECKHKTTIRLGSIKSYDFYDSYLIEDCIKKATQSN